MSGPEKKTEKNPGNRLMRIAALGVLIVALILVFGSFWIGRSASKSAEEAVHRVSLFYLDELAGRREQVVENNLQTYIKNISIGIDLMDEGDIDTKEHLEAYQARMKQLYGLQKFAFVDEKGLIYTSTGTQTDIDTYLFDYRTLSEPKIAIKDIDKAEKKVIIAIPIDPISFQEEKLTICFMEIDMEDMLAGVSMESNENDETFCNIYSNDGISLTNKVLGGLADETNLLEAMNHVNFETGYSREQIADDFSAGKTGVSTFEYDNVLLTLYYVPVKNTDLMLSYMVRESQIGEQIASISHGIIRRSVLQTILTALVLLGLFMLMMVQTRRAAALVIEKEKSEAENRIKQEELEQRLALQEQLLEQEKEQAQLDNMITAMAADYRSVYYVELDTDEGICYRADHTLEDSLDEGDRFDYQETFSRYAETDVDEAYRQDFLEFIQPEHIRKGLAKETILTLRYLVRRGGRESYEMLRMASVSGGSDRKEKRVNAIGVGFTDIDSQMRETLDKNQALSDALNAAEEASKAKTAFLSNMSHEIRTPMNAIIGLDNIALSDPNLSEETRDHLEKIDSSAKHLLNLINDILDMSRIESGRMVLKNEEFSFSAMLEQINTMISSQCSEKGLDYHCRTNGEIDDSYIGDDMKLRQVIINILGNAVKFTPEGGQVNFTVERKGRFGGKATILMTMQDTGIGMDKDYLPKIFDAFSQEDSSTTNKYGSSGLGLAITKNIVKMMNGDIRVESEKGEGTTFFVTVTLQETRQHGPAEEHGVQIDVHDMTVLIIDDDPVACEHGRLALGKVGINAETAESGAEAIEMVRLRHARREPYNLILVDWKMPEMDGVETTRQIRALTGDESAIIILTAYRWEDVLEEAVSAGVDSFLSKPLFASSVIEEFRKALGKKQRTEETVQHKADLTGRRILLAEDVLINAQIVMMQLKKREIEIDHAENGRLAVEMFESHPEGYYDAILMDMRMPEMDGLEATRVIRAMDRPDAKEIPIIALTANAFDDDVEKSLTAGLNAHLSKPVEPDNLFGTLESLIRD